MQETTIKRKLTTTTVSTHTLQEKGYQKTNFILPSLNLSIKGLCPKTNLNISSLLSAKSNKERCFESI